MFQGLLSSLLETAPKSLWLAGPELARFSAPLEIRWPKRRAEPGEQRTIRSAKTEKAEKAVLVVQVASAFALDLQMASARLIEGLNRRLGFDCIGAIQIRQGTLPAKPTRQRRLAPDPALIAELRAGLHDIESDRLKDALATLGAEISRKSASGKF